MNPEIPEYIRKLQESGYLAMLPMLCAMATIELSDKYITHRLWPVPTGSLFEDASEADRWLEATSYIIPHGALIGPVEARIDHVVYWLANSTHSRSKKHIQLIKELLK